MVSNGGDAGKISVVNSGGVIKSVGVRYSSYGSGCMKWSVYTGSNVYDESVSQGSD